jgi:hypothetical protein
MATEIIYNDLNADNEDLAPMEIESLCMNCHENVCVLLLVNELFVI